MIKNDADSRQMSGFDALVKPRMNQQEKLDGGRVLSSKRESMLRRHEVQKQVSVWCEEERTPGGVKGLSTVDSRQLRRRHHREVM